MVRTKMTRARVMATGRRREGLEALGLLDLQVAEESPTPTYGSSYGSSMLSSLDSWSRPGRDPLGIVS